MPVSHLFPEEEIGRAVVKQLKGFGLVSKAPSKFFVVGEVIPATGVYQVFHGPHRLAHEVTLLAGETFPRCAVCKDDVHFKLVHAAPRIAHDASFHIRLYEIPHPEQDEKIDVFPGAASA